MKFMDDCPGSLRDAITSFADLPHVYESAAAAFGTKVLYLVDWWAGGYSNKGDYVVDPGLGGLPGLRQAVRDIHRAGGYVVLYLEPFIVNRTSNIGRTRGRDWAMVDASGQYYGYPGTGDAFYLMQPSSGWRSYLANVTKQLVRDVAVDGWYLDSFGCQCCWHDFNPASGPDASSSSHFDNGAIQLTQAVRAAAGPHALVFTECDVQIGLDNVTGVAMDESLATLQRQPWYTPKSLPYQIFTSEFSLLRMQEIIRSNLSVSLAPWWLDNHTVPTNATVSKWLSTEMSLEHSEDRRRTQRTMREFMKFYNVLYANGLEVQLEANVEWLLRQTIPFTCDTVNISTGARV